MLIIISLNMIMLSGIMLNAIMLSVIMLSVIMLSVIMPSVVIQSVVAPSRLQQLLAMTIRIKYFCNVNYGTLVQKASVFSRLFANRVKSSKVEHHGAAVCWLGQPSFFFKE